jgi:phosphate transport system permease protein
VDRLVHGADGGPGMKLRSPFWRRVRDRCVKITCGLAGIGGCALLIWILAVVYQRGSEALRPSFFTEAPTPPLASASPGESDFDFSIPDEPAKKSEPGPTTAGGMGNDLIGSLLITALATLLAVPIGVLAGFYLAEFGRHSWLASCVRFSANVAFGVPSIIVGVFIYVIMVRPSGSFSGYAGGVALAILMLPIIARTTEDMLRLVPDKLREATLALGATRWQTTLLVSRAARSGILTGILLAIARISGETAPLLFTALNNWDWLNLGSLQAFHRSFSGPTPNMMNQIYLDTSSNWPDQIQRGWAGALVVTLMVLVVTILARLLFRGRTHDIR